jgi:hypothetical protein
MRFRRRLPVAIAALALIAACSDGGGDTSPTSGAPDTLEISTLPTVVETELPATTTTEAATTTTEAPLPTYPLTGVPVAGDGLVVLRPAVVAKVGNYDAHPQQGVNLADIVFEEIINDNVSRFAMVFQSQGADLVGPIRSGRIQDVDLLGSFNSPILAWSGGNGTVTREIDDSDLINMSPNHCGSACFRVNFDKAPYNLFFNINKAWEQAPPGAGATPPQFQYRSPDAIAPGTPSAGVALQMDSYEVEWTWNSATGLYERQQNGRADNDANGELTTTNNVVVLEMVYLPGVSNSPDAQSVGTGQVWVFSAGNMVHGTWSRADRKATFTLTADDGTPIVLTPGRTFVELPRTGGNVTPK